MQNQKNLLPYFLILSAVLVANVVALFYQFYFKELPCPLCLLQRVGLFFIGYGAFMNLKFGKRFRYDFIIIISSLYSMAVATRQVLLHIEPGDLGYGSTFLDLHFYTWNDIISFGFILIIALLPMFKNLVFNPVKSLVGILFVVFVVLLGINLVSVFLECGLKQCPDNPTSYMELGEE